MTQDTARRVLILAFALSILVHLLGVRLVHWSVPTAQEAPETTTLSRILVIHRITHTPLPQTPRPAPTPLVTPVRLHRKPIAVPHLASSSGPPAHHVIPLATAPPPVPVQTPSPLPSATPQVIGGCVTPNAPAAVKTLAPAPEMPLEIRQTAKSGTTRVHLRLSQTGAVLDAGIALSSGSDAQDQLALAQAKNSIYAPALAQCKAVAGTYDFTAKFVIP